MKKDQRGFVMLEVLIVIMTVLLLTSAGYLLIGMEHRRVQSRIKEDEAYYAALAAVRMMAQEVLNGDDEEGTIAHELISGSGMKKRTSMMTFESDEIENIIQIPVTVWTEHTGDELLLAAEAGSGANARTMTLLLKYIYKEDGYEDADSEVEHNKQWVLVSYQAE